MNKKTIYKCLSCGSAFLQWPSQVGENAYCSKDCYTTAQRGKAPHNKGRKTVATKPCGNCGKSIEGEPSSVARRKYCSRKCAGSANRVSLEDALKRYQVSPDTGCWLWSGSKRGGYGRLNLTEVGKTVEAHRASYEFHVEPIPEGLELDHLCRNRSCINPAHLEPVTNAENIRRGDAGKGVRSDAHKAAISAGGKRRFQNADARSKQKAILDSARSSEKRAAALKSALNDPEYRAKKSEQMKAIWAKRKGLPHVSD